MAVAEGVSLLRNVPLRSASPRWAATAVLWIVFAVLVGSISGSRPVAAEVEPEGWESLESTSFRMLSGAAPERGAEILVDLELFRRAFEQLAPGLDAGFPIPTWVIAFSDADAYAAFKTAADTSNTRILGQFLGHRDGNFITLNADPSMSSGLGIIIHEYVHQIVNQNLPKVPRWLNEGLAEYYSTFSVESGFAVIGRSVGRHMGWWRRNGDASILEILSEPQDARRHEPENAGRYYAVSWALAHYLMSSPGGPGALAAYVEEVSLGADGARTLLSALGVSARELEEELGKYIRADILPTASLPLEDLGPVEFTRSVSPPEATLTILGELAARVGHERHADQIFDLALAYDATNAEALAGLAGLRDEQARLEEAGALYAQALEAGPSSALTFLRHGRHLLRRIEAEREQGPERARQLAGEAKTSFLAALALDPGFAEVYSMLAMAHLFEGLEAEDGIVFAERARELLPTRADVVHTLIRLQLKRGAFDRAAALLDGSFRLLADRDAQEGVIDEIRRAEFLFAAQQALADRRWDEGLELFDRAITHTTDAQVRLQMEQQLEDLERRVQEQRGGSDGSRR